jgi:hypothetical protein
MDLRKRSKTNYSDAKRYKKRAKTELDLHLRLEESETAEPYEFDDAGDEVRCHAKPLGRWKPTAFNGVRQAP